MAQVTGNNTSGGDPTLSPQPSDDSTLIPPSSDDPTLTSQVSNDPTPISPEPETRTEEISAKTTEDSDGVTPNKFHYKVYFTSGSKDNFNGDSMGLDFKYDGTVVPTFVEKIESPHADQDTVISYNNAVAFRKAVKRHLEKQPIIDMRIYAKNIRPNYAKIDADLKEGLAKRVEGQVTELYNEWSDHGKKNIGFDREYVDSKEFSRLKNKTEHQT